MLLLIRGIPGSGKSTFAKFWQKENEKDDFLHFEADDFFFKNGKYKFDISKIKLAHQFCLENAKRNLLNGKNVIVSNTFTRIWEIKPYIDFCKENNIKFVIVRMTGHFSNIHNVPEKNVEDMKKRFEDINGEIIVDSKENKLSFV